MKRSYSLIFMTDQGKTSRVRIGSGTLRFIIILCIALPLLLGGTLWAGWELLQRYSALRAENAALSAKLTEQSDIITRLGNLEQFLRAADPELLQQVLGPTRTALENAVPTTAEEKRMPEPADGPAESSEISAEHAEKQETTPASPPSRAAEAPDTASSPPAAQEEPAKGESVKPNLPPRHENSSGEAAVPPLSSPGSSADAAQIDKGLAEIKNMKARRVGTRNLRISLDLYNTARGKQLAGKVDFELVLADGSILPLTGGGDTSYRINRLKKIVSNPILPADSGNMDGAAVRAKVYAGNELIYSGSMPLQQ
ncbi:MAG: hypothetical protein DBY37_00850 [Desulfovibrionaceae bacterium]|nr:MAG: hypothetical protein DBY37_00850 [Desulfovibrionaceae bacterium]